MMVNFVIILLLLSSNTKGLFGCDGSVPFPHTNDRFLPF